MPGGKNLGLGRHWHFLTIHFWIATGIVYVALVFTSGYWRYLVPTDWSIVPEALSAVGRYLQLELPPELPGEPFTTLAIVIAGIALFAIVLVHAGATVWARVRPRTAQRVLGVVVHPFERAVSRLFTSRQHYRRADISPYHRVNGYPPVDPDYARQATDAFTDYRLPLAALVDPAPRPPTSCSTPWTTRASPRTTAASATTTRPSPSSSPAAPRPCWLSR